MPACRLTADCIWNSFRSSGKRHLLLTGSRGSGKSTLLRQLFPHPVPGLTTWAQPGQAVFLKENETGETAAIGEFHPTQAKFENQMKPRAEGFLSLGIGALERLWLQESPWVSIDEIGYLESECQPYQDAILSLMAHKRLAAVVRKQSLPFLQALCRREDVFLVDMDAPFGDTGCVIMASGMGRRFGGNKLMADFGGQPLICRILDATEGIFAKRVVVTRHEDVAALCRSRGVPVVLHRLPYRSDTVRLGLEALGEMERCMFCPADQPLLRRETVIFLSLCAANDDFIWRTCSEGIPGSPVVFPQWALPLLASLPEGKGGGAIIKKYPERVHTLSVRDKAELMDIDTPEDLKILQAIWAGR